MRVLGMARLKLTLLRVLRRLDRVLLKVRRKTKAQLHHKQGNDTFGSGALSFLTTFFTV